MATEWSPIERVPDQPRGRRPPRSRASKREL